MKTSIIPVLLTLAFVGCENDGGSNADGDSTSRLERGISRVGEKLEGAAADVGTEVNESRIQMVIDNIKGMDGVQAEIMEDGSVTLIGNVASDEVRSRAEDLVANIEGVVSVRNSIAVGTGGFVDTNTVNLSGPDSSTTGDSAKRW